MLHVTLYEALLTNSKMNNDLYGGEAPGLGFRVSLWFGLEIVY
jgi:hypothetical protein